MHRDRLRTTRHKNHRSEHPSFSQADHVGRQLSGQHPASVPDDDADGPFGPREDLDIHGLVGVAQRLQHRQRCDALRPSVGAARIPRDPRLLKTGQERPIQGADITHDQCIHPLAQSHRGQAALNAHAGQEQILVHPLVGFSAALTRGWGRSREGVEHPDIVSAPVKSHRLHRLIQAVAFEGVCVHQNGATGDSTLLIFIF